MQFTKEVKQKWIDALESGRYVQLQNDYGDHRDFEGCEKCCLNVLDTVYRKETNIEYPKGSGWIELDKIDNSVILIMANDTPLEEGQKLDYSNVLPLIRELKTVD